MELGRRYDFGRGEGHALKVRDLALKIFDDAERLGLHGMGPRERLWLEAAALLHDVGSASAGSTTSPPGSSYSRPRSSGGPWAP